MGPHTTHRFIDRLTAKFGLMEIRVIGNVRVVRSEVEEALFQRCGVLYHVPHMGKEEEADKQLIRDIAQDDYDHLVLVTGDGDFDLDVRNVKRRGKAVTLITRGQSRRLARLSAAAVAILDFDEFVAVAPGEPDPDRIEAEKKLAEVEAARKAEEAVPDKELRCPDSLRLSSCPSASFANIHLLITHVRTDHPDAFLCNKPKCLLAFSDKVQLNAHLRLAHPRSPRKKAAAAAAAASSPVASPAQERNGAAAALSALPPAAGAGTVELDSAPAAVPAPASSAPAPAGGPSPAPRAARGQQAQSVERKTPAKRRVPVSNGGRAPTDASPGSGLAAVVPGAASPASPAAQSQPELPPARVIDSVVVSIATAGADVHAGVLSEPAAAAVAPASDLTVHIQPLPLPQPHSTNSASAVSAAAASLPGVVAV